MKTSDDPAIRYLAILSALASPHRLRIVAELERGRNYVSQIARIVRLSRPLVQMHLAKLEAAGIVSSRLELSADGKAMRFYELRPFSLVIDAKRVSEIAAGLGESAGKETE
jgi:DNA-binding transcriptional ArsR family regulator